MIQYGITLSAKHRSETNNNSENSNLKSIIFWVKNKTFYNVPMKIKIFCNQSDTILNYVADIRLLCMILVRIDRQKYNILRNENSAMYSK